jgi:hypothetical protein
MWCVARPLLVTKEEMLQVLTDDIKRMLTILVASAESFDEEEAKREYFVRVSILQMVSPHVALEYRAFEVELNDARQVVDTITCENMNPDEEAF